MGDEQPMTLFSYVNSRLPLGALVTVQKEINNDYTVTQQRFERRVLKSTFLLLLKELRATYTLCHYKLQEL